MSGCGFACGGHGFTLSMWLLYRMASATKISLESVVIPTKPHQPLSFNFPKRSFGKKRTVEKPFFIMMNKRMLFFHTCLMGFKLKRMKTSMRADPAFVKFYS